MNDVSKLLREKAASLRESVPELVAVGLLKQAGLSDEAARITVAQDAFEKQACNELTYKGIDMDQAVSLVKAAKINVKDLQGFSLVTEEEALADVFEKVAEYVEQLEVELGKAPTEVRVEVKAPSMPEPLAKMASIGAFTFEDLESLRNIPTETLTKLASTMEEPWSIGHGAGAVVAKTDPLLDFLMN